LDLWQQPPNQQSGIPAKAGIFLILQYKFTVKFIDTAMERVVQAAKSRRRITIRFLTKRKQSRLALLAQPRACRGRLVSDFKFDRDEANTR